MWWLQKICKTRQSYWNWKLIRDRSIPLDPSIDYDSRNDERSSRLRVEWNEDYQGAVLLEIQGTKRKDLKLLEEIERSMAAGLEDGGSKYIVRFESWIVSNTWWVLWGRKAVLLGRLKSIFTSWIWTIGRWKKNLIPSLRKISDRPRLR